MKENQRNTISSRERLRDLEGQIEDAIPVGQPVVYSTHMDLSRLGIDILGERSGGYQTYAVRELISSPASWEQFRTENPEIILEEFLCKDAREYVSWVFGSPIRRTFNIPKEADSYNRSPFKLVSWDKHRGMCVAVAVQYYKTKKNKNGKIK